MRRAFVLVTVGGIFAACGGTVDQIYGPPAVDGGGADAAVDGAIDVPDADAASDAALVLDPSPCLIGGDVWHLDMDFPGGVAGPVTDTEGEGFSFEIGASPASAPALVNIQVDYPTLDSPPYFFEIGGPVDAHGNSTIPLHLGTYTMAAQLPDAGSPELSVSGNGTGCDTLVGSFAISELSISDAGGSSLTVAFAFSCDGPSPYQGCIHIENATLSQ